MSANKQGSMTIKLNQMWTYRLGHQENEKVSSLQAYSTDRSKWIHIAYINLDKISKAKNVYVNAMRVTNVHPHYLKFSINNLIELHKIGSIQDYFDLNTYTAIAYMMVDVLDILDIEIEGVSK